MLRAWAVPQPQVYALLESRFVVRERGVLSNQSRSKHRECELEEVNGCPQARGPEMALRLTLGGLEPTDGGIERPDLA